LLVEILNLLVILTRDAMLAARYMPYLCVRLSQVGVLLKRLKVRSRKQRHTIAKEL